MEEQTTGVVEEQVGGVVRAETGDGKPAQVSIKQIAKPVANQVHHRDQVVIKINTQPKRKPILWKINPETVANLTHQKIDRVIEHDFVKGTSQVV